MNLNLIKPITALEVKTALWDINQTKAPGADGFTSFFFQEYWDILHQDITSSIIKFFQGGKLLPGFNHTILSLIPKVHRPQSVKDLRPISLCTVYYKIISKIITIRLQIILPHILDASQNAFVKGRSIADNISLVHEVKAPGADGFTSFFFQEYWDILHQDITSSIIKFFQGGKLLPGFNHTILSLIPKVHRPQSVKDLRPISLCTVYYKIISKIITIRLQIILPHILDASQNAFVKGRSIADNISLVHEVLHFLRTKKPGHKGYLALKLDISKAYDRLEWGYLKAILYAWGFHTTFISWIMECVSSVTYSIHINGALHGYFHPSRGLRQGDPLSPLLFVLCAEGLSFMIQQAHRLGHFQGITMNLHSPTLTHLFFADDSILFTEASDAQISTVLHILDQYATYSGQLINYTKSAIFFSNNIHASWRIKFAGMLGVANTAYEGNYLGLPLCILHSKKQTFAPLLSKISLRLNGWKEPFLSMSGKEVLLKAVVEAIPVYSMMCFKLPVSLCHRVNSLSSQFWRGQVADEHRYHWVSWHKMCFSKAIGGLGFKDLQVFNQALLAKQVWRILQNPHSLLFQVYRAKYFPTGTFLNAHIGTRPSWGWRSSQFGALLLKEGIRWQCNNGSSIQCLLDPWLPSAYPFLPRLNPGINPNIVPPLVSGLFYPHTRVWNSSFILHLFVPEDAATILSLPLTIFSCVDRLIWHYHSNGNYSVKPGYHFLFNKLHSNVLPAIHGFFRKEWTSLWHAFLPPKIRLFIWHCLHNALPVGELLLQKFHIESHCPHCQESETIMHMLFSCPFARQVWFLSSLSHHMTGLPLISFSQIWLVSTTHLNDPNDDPQSFSLFCFTLWFIWKTRNAAIFRQEIITAEDTMALAYKACDEFLSLSQHSNATSSSSSSTIPQPSSDLLHSPDGITINVDAATDQACRFGTVAAVATNLQGLVIAQFTAVFRSIWDPGILEFLAIREALNWAIACH
ncbi:uncharacterized protein LOC126657132 [Mercurialis annua]|uniref:uncharacterized protein LOC126657132 n=1 Tax=Mercurialis annua TaxID=3986 RepID=UPI002160B452|nr:uncharacterized protein LOC126657132 [Mercurialis annua]